MGLFFDIHLCPSSRR